MLLKSTLFLKFFIKKRDIFFTKSIIFLNLKSLNRKKVKIIEINAAKLIKIYLMYVLILNFKFNEISFC